MYKLLIYIKDHDLLHLVDTIHSENEDYLVNLGQERCNRNPDYVAILVTYKKIDAKLIS